MDKIIKTEQINAVLQTVYQTSISAQSMDALKKFFQDLPEVKVEKPVEVKK